ncbi:MAG: glycerol-3-phosphate 1-O-acyltransferase PlsY [Chloroflexi bacterium]|nr:glycerol-3-phosphate 1-O-acyltransferase PlsY [Chloroflexota bacterium]
MIILVLVASYFWGSVPWGLVVGKLTHRVDIRKYGSGKIGFANVLRTSGFMASVIVLVADLSKGALAVLLARYALHSSLGEMAAALAAIAGHNWSLFIGFQGGRGVTASLGASTTMVPWSAVPGLAVALVTMATTRYVSLGSMLGAATVLVVILILVLQNRAPQEYLIFGVIALSLIVFQHRDNIVRLWAGRERRLGEKGERREHP